VSHEPVAAAVHLFVERSIGDTVLTDSTDANGEFLFPGMYVSSPPVNSYARLQFDAPPPYATATISPVTLGAIDLSLEVPLGNADVFLVSISDSGLYLDYFHSALRALNVSANVWDIARRGPAPLSKGREFGFRTAVLYTGDLAAPLAAEMLDSIAACVGSGGSVFLTGQNIAEFNAGSPLFSSTLGVGFAGNTSIAFNQGVAGDILQGFSCFTTGSGANNQVSRDSLLPLRPGVHRVLDYGSGTGRAAALRVDSAGPGGAKAVVMGFGFEAIHTAAKRQALMLSVLNYFRGLTAMEHAGAAAVPAGFALEQNFPNPFNPATTIRFRVPQAARVTLELFDAAGRKIALLVDERVERGEHAVPWSGAGLASGVYYCRLQAYDGAAASPRYTETRKLLLLQ
jgi:hypothetical protein